MPRVAEWLLTRHHGEILATELTSSANPPEEIAVYRDAITRPGAAWAGLAYYRAVFLDIRTDARRLRGRKVASPTLVLWGEQDPAFGKELTDDFDRYVRGPMRLQVSPMSATGSSRIARPMSPA